MTRKVSKIILAITGEIASGKGEMACYVEKKHGARAYRSSEVLRDILKRIDLPQNRINLQKTSMMLRQFFGEDIIAHITCSDLSRAKNKIIAIDGVRRISDISDLKKNFVVKIVYVEASLKNRYKRLHGRRENVDDKNKTWKQFKKDHEQETEKSILSLKSQADYLIENNGTKKDFYRKIDQLVSNLTKQNKTKA